MGRREDALAEVLRLLEAASDEAARWYLLVSDDVHTRHGPDATVEAVIGDDEHYRAGQIVAGIATALDRMHIYGT